MKFAVALLFALYATAHADGPLGDGKTSMRAASLGFGTDEESLAMRRFFESGNQLTIDRIRAHLAPVAAGSE